MREGVATGPSDCLHITLGQETRGHIVPRVNITKTVTKTRQYYKLDRQPEPRIPKFSTGSVTLAKGRIGLHLGRRYCV